MINTLNQLAIEYQPIADTAFIVLVSLMCASLVVIWAINLYNELTA